MVHIRTLHGNANSSLRAGNRPYVRLFCSAVRYVFPLWLKKLYSWPLQDHKRLRHIMAAWLWESAFWLQGHWVHWHSMLRWLMSWKATFLHALWDDWQVSSDDRWVTRCGHKVLWWAIFDQRTCPLKYDTQSYDRTLPNSNRWRDHFWRLLIWSDPRWWLKYDLDQQLKSRVMVIWIVTGENRQLWPIPPCFCVSCHSPRYLTNWFPIRRFL